MPVSPAVAAEEVIPVQHAVAPTVRPEPKPLAVLQKVFGYSSFRGKQQAVIETLVDGNDAVVLFPTGAGKSLCYQIPALCRRGVGIVVSPLIALLSALAACDCPPRTFVRTGTIAEYGDCPTPFTETERERPGGSYAASLLAGTHYLEMAQPRLPFFAATARLALTYGPGQSESFLIPRAITQLLAGQKVSVRSPLDRRDLIHVDDVTTALMLLGDNPESAGPVVNVGTGDSPTVAEVMRTLIKLTDADVDLVKFSDQVRDPVELIVSAERIRECLGWSAEIKLQDGLERTVKWARENIIPNFATEMQA